MSNTNANFPAAKPDWMPMEWWAFFLALFARTGGAGSPVDVNDLLAQIELLQEQSDFQSGSVQPAMIFDLARSIADLWAEQRSVQDSSFIVNRVSDLENSGDLRIDLSRTNVRIDDLEKMVSEIRLPTLPVPEQWIAPTLLNSWVYYGVPYNPPGYYKDANGTVHLRGMVKSGTIGTAIFTLPAGYRPANQEIFPTISNDLFGGCYITTGGNVTAYVGSAFYFSIDGITFRAA